MPDPAPSSRPTILMVNSIKFWGGGEQWFNQVAGGLRSRGYHVTVAGREGGVFLTRITDSSIPVLPLVMRSDYSVGDILALRRLLKSQTSCVVFCNLSRDIRLAGLAAAGLRNIRVIWVMGSILVRNRWRDRFWVRRRIDRILIPSRALASELTQLRYMKRSQLAVIPIGIDLREWAVPDSPVHEPESRGPIVGAFGRLENRKGHRYLLDAWPAVHACRPRAELWIVGTGSRDEALRAQAASLAVGDSVRFLGFQSDVRAILAMADLVVQPSLYEPFGIILLEAMALGKPIVCTTAGGMPEVVDKECALLVTPGDSNSLTGAILQILDDPGLGKRMGEAGRARAEADFNLVRMIDRVEALVEEVSV